jgi:hypothetical protein
VSEIPDSFEIFSELFKNIISHLSCISHRQVLAQKSMPIKFFKNNLITLSCMLQHFSAVGNFTLQQQNGLAKKKINLKMLNGISSKSKYNKIPLE